MPSTTRRTRRPRTHSPAVSTGLASSILTATTPPPALSAGPAPNHYSNEAAAQERNVALRRETSRLWSSFDGNVDEAGYRTPNRFEHRGRQFRISRDSIRAIEDTPTPPCKEREVRVAISPDSDNFEDALANALIPLLAKKIKALNAGEFLPTIVHMEKGGEYVVIRL